MKTKVIIRRESDEQRLYTKKDVSDILEISDSTVNKWIEQDVLEAEDTPLRECLFSFKTIRQAALIKNKAHKLLENFDKIPVAFF